MVWHLVVDGFTSAPRRSTDQFRTCWTAGRDDQAAVPAAGARVRSCAAFTHSLRVARVVPLRSRSGKLAMLALRLAVVALAFSASVLHTAADAVTFLGSTTMAATLALSALPVGSPALTQLAGGDSGTCGVTTTIQLSDTISSIM